MVMVNFRIDALYAGVSVICDKVVQNEVCERHLQLCLEE